jgi:hypothetical protein
MKTRPLSLALLYALALATPASAQFGALTVTAGMPDSGAWTKSTRAPVLKRCADPDSRVGWWRGSGSVAFTIDSAGRIDTSTVMAVKTSVSEAGLESYARRLLAGCTWQPARVEGQNTTVVVRLEIQPEVEKPAPSGPFLRAPTEPGLYLRTSRKVEEGPRMRSCPEPDIKGAGRMEFSYIIGIDGRVEAGSVVLLATASESVGAAWTKLLLACIYQPGRIGGEPVRILSSGNLTSSSLTAVDEVQVRTTTRP